MANIRLLSPPAAKSPITITGGRIYTPAAGTLFDVPDFDARQLEANAWIKIATVGTTTQRPAIPIAGDHYMDTTLTYVVVFDGVSWRNPNTGGVV